MGAEKDPVTPELRRLLDLEADRADPPEALREQVRRELSQRLWAGHSRRRPTVRRWAGAGAAATSVALVATVAWVLHRPARLPAANPPVASVVSTAPAPEPVEHELAPEPALPTAAPVPAPAPKKLSRRPAADLGNSLAREREIIAQARAALRGSDPNAALALLRRHAVEFPDGILLEERLGLQVEALAASGRIGQARERAREFRQRFPESPLREAVDAALGQLPARAAP